MLLDPANIVYFDGIGIFIYFPELNRVLFYKEKNKEGLFGSDKKFVFSKCDLSEDNNIICTKKDKPSNILFFESIHSTEEFKAYFKTRQNPETRYENIPYFKNGDSDEKDVDYFLLQKKSEKLGRKSIVINRIVRINWEKKEIKYYGGGTDSEPYSQDDMVRYDVHIPDYEFKYTIKDFLIKYNHPVFKTAKYNEFSSRLAYNNGMSELFNDEIIKKYLIKVGLMNGTFKFSDLLKCLDSSPFKGDWLKYFKKNQHTLLSDLFHGDSEGKITSYNADRFLNQFDSYKINSETVSKDPFKLHLKFNDKDKVIFKEFEINNENVSKLCGTDNCFQILEDSENSVKYGVRFSTVIYQNDTIEYYNMIIELVINCILDYMFNYSKIFALIEKYKKSKSIALIQKINNVGMYTITINDGSEEKKGFIPYIITELNPNKQIKDLLKFIKTEILIKPDIWTVELITQFILLLLIKIYNFYLIAYSTVGFKHYDFKLNNIVIEYEKDKEGTSPLEFDVYIIDFGFASINLQYDSNLEDVTINGNNFILDKRDHNFDLEKGDGSYKTFYDNVNNKHFSSDLDFETLYWWLLNPTGYNLDTEKVIPEAIRAEIDSFTNLKIYNSALSRIMEHVFFNKQYEYEFPNANPNANTKITQLGKRIKEVLLNPIPSPFINSYNLIMYRLNELFELLTKILRPPKELEHYLLINPSELYKIQCSKTHEDELKSLLSDKDKYEAGIWYCTGLIPINIADKQLYQRMKFALTQRLHLHSLTVRNVSTAGGSRIIKNNKIRNKKTTVKRLRKTSFSRKVKKNIKSNII